MYMTHILFLINVYILFSWNRGRYLLQFSTAQHRFELSMRSRESNIDPQGKETGTIDLIVLHER